MVQPPCLPFPPHTPWNPQTWSHPCFSLSRTPFHPIPLVIIPTADSGPTCHQQSPRLFEQPPNSVKILLILCSEPWGKDFPWSTSNVLSGACETLPGWPPSSFRLHVLLLSCFPTVLQPQWRAHWPLCVPRACQGCSGPLYWLSPLPRMFPLVTFMVHPLTFSALDLNITF